MEAIATTQPHVKAKGITPLSIRMIDLDRAIGILKTVPKTWYQPQIEDLVRDMENDLQEYKHSLEYSNGRDPQPWSQAENVDGRV